LITSPRFDHLHSYDYAHNMVANQLKIHEVLLQCYKNRMKSYIIYSILFMVPYNLDYHNDYSHYLLP
jgi:hypothetical protein